METLLVDKAVAGAFLPQITRMLADKNVRFFTDAATREILKPSSLNLQPATEQNWFTEYNDYILNVRVVDGVPAAIGHINYYGSAHSEIGISTDKIGARGPMGLDELTSYKWLGIGSGQIRT